VSELYTRATTFEAWKNLGNSSEGCSFASERLSTVTHSRSTRLASSGQFPGQLVEDTFVSQMAKMWNGLPEEIKTVTIKIKAKSMIRNFCE
jgi:hypothetical protein